MVARVAVREEADAAGQNGVVILQVCHKLTTVGDTGEKDQQD